MPNHYSNMIVIITQDDEQSPTAYWTSRLRPYEKAPGLLGHLIPRPEGLADWYAWSTEHWGTKWGIYEAKQPVALAGDASPVLWSFATAWGPPHEKAREAVMSWFLAQGARHVFWFGHDPFDHSMAFLGEMPPPQEPEQEQQETNVDAKVEAPIDDFITCVDAIVDAIQVRVMYPEARNLWKSLCANGIEDKPANEILRVVEAWLHAGEWREAQHALDALKPEDRPLRLVRAICAHAEAWVLQTSVRPLGVAGIAPWHPQALPQAGLLHWFTGRVVEAGPQIAFHGAAAPLAGINLGPQVVRLQFSRAEWMGWGEEPVAGAFYEIGLYGGGVAQVLRLPDEVNSEGGAV